MRRRQKLIADGAGSHLRSEGRLISICEFLRRYFSSESAPSAHTVRRWLEAKKLPGVKFCRTWFIDVVALQTGGDPLLAKILCHGRAP